MTGEVRYSKMVALGSSFASGPGIEPLEHKGAMRSARNYPHVVAEALGTTLVDATVAGATTATILHTRQRLGRHTFPPQVEAVPDDADLVTLTIGGNDLGYLSGVIKVALLQRLLRHPMTRPIARRLGAERQHAEVTPERAQETCDQVAKVIEAVRQRAPRARVFVVDYLPIFTEQSAPGAAVPFSSADITHFRGVAGVLSDLLREAATRSGADFLPACRYDQGHGTGTADPWVFGWQPVRKLASSFHPTPAGMQAVADALVRELAVPQ